MPAGEDPSETRRTHPGLPARLRGSVTAPAYAVWDVCEEMLRCQAEGTTVDQAVGDESVEQDGCPDYLPKEWL